jgi:hypothetical protein
MPETILNIARLSVLGQLLLLGGSSLFLFMTAILVRGVAPSFLEVLSGGAFLMSCVLLLSAPFSLLSLAQVSFNIASNGRRANTGYILIYLILYVHYLEGAYLFNITNPQRFYVELLDPIRLTGFLVREGIEMVLVLSESQAEKYD